MNKFFLLVNLLLPFCMMGQTFTHDGLLDDDGRYIGKQHWHDATTNLLVAEVIYDDSGRLLSYKTWVDGDIMDAEELPTDRSTIPFPEKTIILLSSLNDPLPQVQPDGTKVLVQYKGWLQDGTLFEDNTDRKPFKFTIGAEQVIPGFEQAVRSLEVGQSILVRIPPEMAYRNRAINLIPPFSQLWYEITLVGTK